MEVATIKRMATVMIKFKIEKGQFSEEDKKVAIQVLKQRGQDVSKWETGEVKEEQPADMPGETQEMRTCQDAPEEENEGESQSTKLDPKTVEIVDKAIEEICECEYDDIKLKAGDLMGDDPKETEDLTKEQVEGFLELAKELKKRNEEKKAEKKGKTKVKESVKKEEKIADPTEKPVESVEEKPKVEKKAEATPRKVAAIPQPTEEELKAIFSVQSQKKIDQVLEILKNGTQKKRVIIDLWDLGLDKSEIVNLKVADPTYTYDLIRAQQKISEQVKDLKK
jgi:hypothetical protein|nr:MAG TPA: hypothetical protein [Caudoviricetes sp.]